MSSTTNVCPICLPFLKSQTLVIDSGLAGGPRVVTKDTEEI